MTRSFTEGLEILFFKKLTADKHQLLASTILSPNFLHVPPCVLRETLCNAL